MESGSNWQYEQATAGLEKSALGAAGLFKAAELAGCATHSLLTLAGVAPVTVATEVLGLEVEEGQSPLSIARGVRFESVLMRDEAAALREALHAAPGALLDLSKETAAPGEDLHRARERATVAALPALLRPEGPSLLWQAAFTVELGGTGFRISPDLLVRGQGQLVVGEAKSFPDRGAYIEQSDLRSALGQAAVGRLALDQAAARADLPAAARHVLLVLPRPGGLRPTVRRVEARREHAVLARADARLPLQATRALAAVPAGATLQDPAVIRGLPRRYGDLCRSRCALAPWCRAQAREFGDPVVLGEAVAKDLQGLTLAEAARLLSAAPPDAPQHADDTGSATIALGLPERAHAVAAAARAWQRALTS